MSGYGPPQSADTERDDRDQDPARTDPAPAIGGRCIVAPDRVRLTRRMADAVRLVDHPGTYVTDTGFGLYLVCPDPDGFTAAVRRMPESCGTWRYAARDVVVKVDRFRQVHPWTEVR